MAAGLRGGAGRHIFGPSHVGSRHIPANHGQEPVTSEPSRAPGPTAVKIMPRT
jgi:hypothetical protein